MLWPLFSYQLKFEPTPEKLEALLSLYKKAQGRPRPIRVLGSAAAYREKTFPAEQVWASLEYAIALMNKDYRSGRSPVEVRLVLR